MLRLFSILLIFGAMSFASPIYSVTTLQGPSGWTGLAMYGINDAGQVVGDGNNGANYQAFIASPSGPVAIPMPAGWNFEDVYAINNVGQVVGTGGGTFTGDYGFTATPSGVVPIPLSGSWAFVTGNGINDAGHATGEAGNGSTFLPYIGAAGIAGIPLPPGSTFGGGIAINNSGVVTGDGYDFAGGVATNYTPFIGTPAGVAIIPTLGGWTMVSAEAINNSGLVAGFGYTSTSPTSFQAFVGTAAGVTAIPLPAGATSANIVQGSINDAGAVVGNSTNGGWIWTASDGTQLMNVFVPSGWNINDAISISNSGLILAYGSFEGGPQGYLELSPVAPEPAAGLLASGAILLLVCARWRTGKSLLI